MSESVNVVDQVADSQEPETNSGVELKRDLLKVVSDHEQAAMLKNMNE